MTHIFYYVCTPLAKVVSNTDYIQSDMIILLAPNHNLDKHEDTCNSLPYTWKQLFLICKIKVINKCNKCCIESCKDDVNLHFFYIMLFVMSQRKKNGDIASIDGLKKSCYSLMNMFDA